ncbi:TetR/AcrR family transcriptional regulator [Modestobacter excelsi]|uniref:TetR/AcrR family transcriptional regulator n=1 Tax=Modestobacter excelsi TaxID=2213161 RepID=UPI001C20D957|nr:TetR/AcrR family transcriptional regulator [Modestobacter excelsi]
MVYSTEQSERGAAITAAAARLFATRGFNGAGMDDIGAAVGMSGPALYRHFRSKQELLAAVVDQLQRTLLEAVDDDEKVDLGRVIAAVMAHGDALAVALRQARHLDHQRAPDQLRVRTARLQDLWARHESARHPHEDQPTSAVRLRAAAGAVVGLSFAKSGALSLRTGLAEDITSRILSIDLTEPLTPPDPDLRGAPRDLASLTGALRREAILAVAARQFADKGFHGTSLGDIGAMVGITGSAVMRHFTSKEGLLEASFSRLADNITERIYRQITADVAPLVRLSQMIDDYTELALRSADLVVINMTELRCLPVEYQRERRRSQRMYVNELAQAVIATQPGLDELEARLRAQAAYALINEVVADERLVHLHGLRTDLRVLAEAAVVPS